MTTAEKIYEAVKPLPEAMAREVLDFIEFVKTRRDQAGDDNLIAAQAISMANVWDNPDDEVWNDAAPR